MHPNHTETKTERLHYNSTGSNSPTSHLDGPAPSSFAFPESPGTIAMAKHQMMEAVAFLPFEDRQYFLGAPPGLVQKESDPLLFLRTHDFDVWKAARRLVEYWKLRFETLGEDRCYLPLDLSGLNAISPSVVKFTETGVGYLMPADKKNRSCLVCECPYLGPKDDEKRGITLQGRQQTSFYLMHLLAHEPQSNQEGCTIIYMVDNRQHKVSPSMYQWYSRATRDCFPLKLKGLHLIFAPLIPDAKKRRGFAETLLPFIWQILEEGFRFTRRSLDFVPVVSKGKSKEDIANLLMLKSHFHADVLPRTAGGEWNYAKFKEWKQAEAIARATDLETSAVAVGSADASKEEDNSSATSNDASASSSASPLDMLAAAAASSCSCGGKRSDCPQHKKRPSSPSGDPKILSRVFRRKDRLSASGSE